MNIVYHKSFIPLNAWGGEVDALHPVVKYRSELRVSVSGQDVIASVETSPSDFHLMTAASKRDWYEAMNFNVMRDQIMHLIKENIFGKRVRKTK